MGCGSVKVRDGLREAPLDGHAKMLERIKKGPQKGQSRGQMIIDLGHATNELQKAGSFGGGMLWSGVIAGYEKALGYPITPKVGLGNRELDLSTVKFAKRGFNVNLALGGKAMGCGSVKVRDGLRGINVLRLVYSSPDVVIFSADLTARLKGREPAWLISCDGIKTRKMELIWLGGLKDRRKTVINFGKKFLDGWCPVMSVSRYTLEVIFYRRELRDKPIERKPLFERACG